MIDFCLIYKHTKKQFVDLTLIEKLGLAYMIIPYIHSVKNRTGLIFSIITGRSKYKIKLKDKIEISFKDYQFGSMLNLLGILSFSTDYKKISGNLLEFSLDTQNKFSIHIESLTNEDQNLLELIFGASRFSADFVTKKDIDFKNYRDKTIKIFKENNKTIVETSEGIKFFLDSIHPGNTIVECFIQKTHLINSLENWEDKIVVDGGAEMGDTPLYYANLGAKVFAIEPIKEHYEAMLRNISLNPSLVDRIIPINAAIGKNEELTFYQDDRGIVGDTSFLVNTHGENTKTRKVRGYSMSTLFHEFNIEHIDLLKLDCKGCEYFISEKDLEKIDRIKIEFNANNSPLKLESLLNKLKTAGFEYMLYKTNPRKRTSNRTDSHVFGKKNLIKES